MTVVRFKITGYAMGRAQSLWTAKGQSAQNIWQRGERNGEHACPYLSTEEDGELKAEEEERVTQEKSVVETGSTMMSTTRNDEMGNLPLCNRNLSFTIMKDN